MKRIIVLCAGILLSATPALRGQQTDWTVSPFWLSHDDIRGIVTALATPIETQVVKGVPYSAEIVSESIQSLADGNRIVHRRTSRVYRDGQGRIRREEDQPTGSPTISIMDPVAGKGFSLDAANRTARETPPMVLADTSMMLMGGTGTFRALSTGPTSNLKLAGVATRQTGYKARGGQGETVEEKLPDRSIEGVLATGLRRTTTIAQGAIGNEQPIKIVSEQWTSPELQILVLTDHDDPRTGRSTYRLLKISRLEPDPALFQVPADYTIVRSAAGGRGRGR